MTLHQGDSQMFKLLLLLVQQYVRQMFLIHILESSFPIRLLFYDIIFPGFYSLLRMYQKLRVLHSWRVADSILALERSQILYMHIGIYYF